MSNETPEATDDPPRDPWFITVIAVIIFAGIVLFGCTRAQTDGPLSALAPMTTSTIMTEATREEAPNPAHAGYWALCDHNDKCLFSRLLFELYAEQERACAISMAAARTILSFIFVENDGGMHIHTDCRLISDGTPKWWGKMRWGPKEES